MRKAKDVASRVRLVNAVACAHGALSVATIALMLRDGKRPPSACKKKHQMLKWISGAVLAAAAALHVAQASPFGLPRSALALAVLAAFAWHG